MSDIKIEFAWQDLALVALLVGWPGLVLGVLGGAFLWRRHRIIGAVVGAVLGLTLWVGVRVMFA